MRASRLILCVFGACLAGALALAALVPGVARADTVSFSVQGQQFSFDTGDGRDGNVELRLKNGNPNVVEVVVNGNVAASVSNNVEQVLSTSGSLYLETNKYYVDQEKGPWTAPSGTTIARVHFRGRDGTGYLYARANSSSSWQQITTRSSAWDDWVLLPPGMREIKVRLYHNGSSYSFPQYVDAPEVVVSSPRATVMKNVMELDGRPLSQRSDLTYTLVKLENIAPYLPATKTYAPSLSITGDGPPSSVGTVPQFNNLTVGPGVMLTADIHVVFKVKNTLTVRGVIMSQHGRGGGVVSFSSLNGENARGDVVVLAGTIVVAPDGATGESGAILAGWGGGGGAYGQSAGRGGNGGNVYAYASRLVNRAEIRAGNGGGGAVYIEQFNGTGAAAAGGTGGKTVVVAAVLEGGGVIASGLSGTDGGYIRYTAGAGYGGGAKVQGQLTYYTDPDECFYTGIDWTVGALGGEGGLPGTAGGGAGYGGTTAYGGNITVGYSRDDGELVVKAGRLVKIPGIRASFLVGYSDGGWTGGYASGQQLLTGVRARKTIWIDAVEGNPAVSIGAGMYVPRNFAGSFQVLSAYNSIIFGTPQAPVSVTIKDLFFSSLVVNGNATFTGNLYFLPDTVQVTGQAAFASSSYIYAKSGLPARFTVGQRADVSANADTSSSDYVSFYTTGNDVRFWGRSDYLNVNWWRGRNVFAQGVPVRLAIPSASVNSFGAVSLSLSDWVANYYGVVDKLEFQVERKVEDEPWTQVGSFVRNIGGNPEWLDVNTPLRRNLYYRVGYRRPDAGTGFLFLDDLVVGPIRSEGSALPDEEPPRIEAFLVNGGMSPATSRYVPVELVATDNRTQADQLLVQFEVGGQKRYFDGNAWQAGDGWGPYRQAYDSLDLGQTSGLVKVTVRVKDIAGNVGTAVAQVDLRLDTGYVATGTVTVAGAVAGTYDGLPVLFVRSEKVTLSLGFSGATHVRFGLDGQPFSEWEAYSAQRVVALPKSSGLVVLTVQARDANRYFEPQKLYLVVDGQPPSIARLQGLNGATATRTSSVTLEIYATDNLPGTLQYRYQVNGGAWSPWANLTGGTISVSGLAPGANRITVEVKDQAGNTAQATVTIFRV